MVGSVPQLLQFQNGFLPAVQTTEIDYRVNLASYPLTADHDKTVPGSELLNPANFTANPINGAPANAKIIGSGGDAAGGRGRRLSGTADLSSLNASAGTLEHQRRRRSPSMPVTTGPTSSTAINAADRHARRYRVARGSNQLVLTSADAKTKITIDNTSTLATAEPSSA